MPDDSRTSSTPPPVPEQSPEQGRPPAPPQDPTQASPQDPPQGRGQLSAICSSCGAQLTYAPGTTHLRCDSCGGEQEIAGAEVEIREHSYDEWRSKHGDVTVASIGAQELQCTGCGARTESKDLAGSCQFCGSALVSVANAEGLVPPEAVIAFHVDKGSARGEVTSWTKSRWFAPNALKKVGSTERLQGTYVPHWTFDAHTETDYQGQRGEYYYTTETRMVSDGKGGSHTETYQQRHTAWHRTSGHVRRDFDDILIVASRQLEPKQLKKMGPWELSTAVPFQPEYLTGYSALRYDVDPQESAKEARGEMRAVIHSDVENDIGGDEQRVQDMDVTYSEAMFKLILMPLWIATYLYAGKTWQVMVNANTGEVVGKRPYSVVKIVAAVIAALIVIGGIAAAVAVSK